MYPPPLERPEQANLSEALRQQRFLSELAALTQRLVEPSDVMAITARMVAEQLAVDRCAYAEIEQESVFVITGDYAREVPSIVGRWPVADFGPECVRCMLAGEPYVVNDVAAQVDPEHLSAYRATTIAAVICVPLHKQGKFTAAMAVHQQVPRYWTPLELELVTQVVARCWEALERTRIARTLQESERLLAERAQVARARLDYAARVSGVGFWYCDLPFDELMWDPRVREHFFVPADARVTIDMFYERIHPEDRALTRAAIERSIQDHHSYDIVYRTVDPDTGATKWVHAQGGTTYAADGTPLRFDGVTLDVSAQRRDRELLTRALEGEREQAARLREQDHRRNEFLATLAHELRNPLAPIRTGLQVLRMGASAAQVERAHEMMERQLGHMVRMIDDLLDISRVTLGKVELQKQRLDLRSVVASAIETTRPLFELTNQRVTISLPERSLPIEGDATRLSQVFANLLNNAAKYTPASGRIELSAEVVGSQLRVHVRDDGIGIPADMLSRVFDMFTQVDRTVQHAQGGLGIGLTLVRTLVEMHGGSIAAHSAGPGQGATFTVELPLAATSDNAHPAASTPEASASVLRVLVVDDNEDAAESLEMLLQLQGHETCVAHTGPDAVRAAQRFRPQLVFLDIGLPEMNGYEVARHIRADVALPRPYLIALTGWGSEDDKRQAMAAGFDRHLVKPFDASKLDDILASAV
jgi:signal transduction histidine kinase